jgi:hypothetical protein
VLFQSDGLRPVGEQGTAWIGHPEFEREGILITAVVGESTEPEQVFYEAIFREES